MIIGDALYLETFFDPHTWTLSYLLMDQHTREAAVIDSVLDYDPKSGRTSTASADHLIARIGELGARLEWILETHMHADHLSAAPYLKKRLGGRIAIGSHVTQVQETFGKLFNAGLDMPRDGSQFDVLFDDGARFSIGQVQARTLHTPGHTPACLTYVVEVAGETLAFIGDTLFAPDYGTARCDFPGADARTLYRSIARILALPPDTRLFMCHDYLPNGRELRYMATVAEQRADNIHIHDGIDEAEFVRLREARDKTLPMPVLMLPSVQINMRAGQFPEPEANGVRYLKIPLDSL